MSEGGYPGSREEQILLVERWVGAFQERGAGWGIHPADLVELIVTLLDAKDLYDAVKTGNAALEGECDEVFKKMEGLSRSLYQKAVTSVKEK